MSCSSRNTRIRNSGFVARASCTPDQLRAHPEPRTARRSRACRLSRRVGGASPLRSPRPSRVSPRAIPDAPWYLRDAVAKFLRRYPIACLGPQLLGSPPARGREDLMDPKPASVLAHTIETMFEDGDLVGDLFMASRLLAMSNPALPQPAAQFQRQPPAGGSCRGDADGIRRAGVERCRVRIPCESDRRLGRRRPPVFVERQSLVQRRRRDHSRLIQRSLFDQIPQRHLPAALAPRLVHRLADGVHGG